MLVIYVCNACQAITSLVQQNQGILSTMDMWAKKATENCSPEAYVLMQREVSELQSNWDTLQSAVAEDRSKLETSRMQLADYDETLKKELSWLRGVDRYLLDAADPCTD